MSESLKLTKANGWIEVDGAFYRIPGPNKPSNPHTLGVLIDCTKEKLQVETDLELAGLMDIDLDILSDMRWRHHFGLFHFIDRLPRGISAIHVFRNREKSRTTSRNWGVEEGCLKPAHRRLLEHKPLW